MNLWVKQQGVVIGPLPLDKVVDGAATKRILPDAQVSSNKITWYPVATLLKKIEARQAEKARQQAEEEEDTEEQQPQYQQPQYQQPTYQQPQYQQPQYQQPQYQQPQYQQPQYQQQGFYGQSPQYIEQPMNPYVSQEKKGPGNALAWCAFGFSIASLFLWWLGLPALVALILSIVGVNIYPTGTFGYKMCKVIMWIYLGLLILCLVLGFFFGCLGVIGAANR